MDEVFRRTGRPADTLVYKSHTHACVYSFRKRVSARHPVTPAPHHRDLDFVGHHVVPQPSRCHVVLIDVGTYDYALRTLPIDKKRHPGGWR